MNSTINYLKFIYKANIHWIDNTHDKANIILLLQTVILGYSLNSWKLLSIVKPLDRFFSCLYLISVFLSTIFVVKVIWPKTSSSRKGHSLIYFKDISDNRLSFNKKVKKFTSMTKQNFANDLSEQIILTSQIATSKYQSLQLLLVFLFIEILLGLIVFF